MSPNLEPLIKTFKLYIESRGFTPITNLDTLELCLMYAINKFTAELLTKELEGI